MEHYQTRLRAAISWPWASIALVAIGLALAGLPEEHEGRTLITLENGHGITIANVVALFFLTSGVGSLGVGASNNSRELLASLRQHPAVTAGLVAMLTVGVAMLFASGLSTVLRWWAPGLCLSVSALIGLAAVIRTSVTP